MSFLRQTGLVSVLALVIGAPAQAAITPEEVWGLWQKLSTDMGYDLAVGATNRKGDSLVLTDVVIGAGPVGQIPLRELNLRDRGDGSVEVTLPEQIDIVVKTEIEGQPPLDVKMKVLQDGYVAVVSGSVDAPVIDMSAKTLQVLQEQVNLPEGEGAVSTQVIMAGLSGKTALKMGEATEITSSVSATTIEAKVQGAAGEDGEVMDVTLSSQDFLSQFEGTIPADLKATAELHEVIAAGLRGTGHYQTGKGAVDFIMRDKGQETKVNIVMDSSRLSAGLEGPALEYSAGAKGLSATFSGPAIPLPTFTLSLGDYSFGLKMPMIKTEAPTDFAASIGLTDLVLPEMAWMMIDPTKTLSRDPATMILDIAGKVRLTENLSEETDTSGAEMPGELHALTLNQLVVKMLGAHLNGAGAFTFDNTDLESFGGVPRPMGAVDFRLEGGNKLLDQLVNLGLIDEDDATGYRMMLAMFTKAAEGEDVMTSKIEVTPEGHVVANGQRIQ